jgi:hypothetical protein
MFCVLKETPWRFADKLSDAKGEGINEGISDQRLVLSQGLSRKESCGSSATILGGSNEAEDLFSTQLLF